MTTYRTEDHWRCKECKNVAPDSQLLKAPNPFDADEVVFGCPVCKAVDRFEEMCDVVDCNQSASCGTPIEGTPSYVRTCYLHWPNRSEV